MIEASTATTIGRNAEMLRILCTLCDRNSERIEVCSRLCVRMAKAVRLDDESGKPDWRCGKLTGQRRFVPWSLRC